MRSCEKCLNNRWIFKTMRDVDDKSKTYTKWSLATCEICGHEVEFGHKELSLYNKFGKRRFTVK